MKIKIDLAETKPDETKFPHFRIGKTTGDIYFFTDGFMYQRLTGDFEQDRSSVNFGNTTYFTGSITLENG